ncbi:MAG: hypothetical protein HQK70_08335 [Desulfamplus sp.]|nr:hypothetical protein [Desulfamplus sp.]
MKPKKNRVFVVVLIFLLFFVLRSTSVYGEDYSFDVSEIEKKSWQFGGYAEFSPVLFKLNEESSLYKLGFYDKDKKSNIKEYNFKVQLEGSYEKGISKVFIRTNSELTNSYSEWSDETAIYEGYFSLKPSSSFRIDIGKKALKWGKGYAWNPVAFLDRPKDPDDPELNLEGFIVGCADYIQSFEGVLKTLALSSVVIPVYEDINDDFGNINHLNFAEKIYFLLYDTDIDLIFMTGASITGRYGFDFSRNISTNLEIHGEFAYIDDYQKRYTDDYGNIREEVDDVRNYLFGIRYLTTHDTTFIAEYLRNDAGYKQDKMKDFFSLIDTGYEDYLVDGSHSLLNKAINIQGKYGRNPMKDYLYFRVSQKEPFDILYFTPSVSSIFNMDDRSFSLSPELLYNGITNLELRLRTSFLEGKEDTEYGEKQSDCRVEFRARYYF